MEMSRILLLCVLVAGAYAKGNKSPRLMLQDTCSTYETILRTNMMMNVKYYPCGESNAQGEPLCYLKRAKCDSIFDCPNQADEENCKEAHNNDCATGFIGKRGVDGTPLKHYTCAPRSGGDVDDKICILCSQVCDETRDCPEGDDEGVGNCNPEECRETE